MLGLTFASHPYRPVWPYLSGIVAFAASVQFGIAGATLDQLGISAESAMLLLLATVACRSASLRLFVMGGGRQRLQRFPEVIRRALLKWRKPFSDESAIALNVGGGLIPLAFSLYELMRTSIGSPQLLIVSIYAVAVAQIVRRPPIRAAMAIPFVLVAPQVALLLGWTLGAEHRAAFTYVSGFAGILAAAALSDLGDLRNIGRPEIVIGGDATFDSIFLIQLFSLLFC